MSKIYCDNRIHKNNNMEQDEVPIESNLFS